MPLAWLWLLLLQQLCVCLGQLLMVLALALAKTQAMNQKETQNVVSVMCQVCKILSLHTAGFGIA